MSVELLGRADRLRAARTPFVLATVVRAERPASTHPGDRAIVHGDGRIEGFVGGACTTATLRVHSAQLLHTGGTTLLRVSPAPAGGGSDPADGVVVVDNPCLSGGSVDILLEAVRPPPLVYVFGDSPIAQALVAVGGAAGYEVQAGHDPQAALPAGAVAVVVAAHGHDEPPVLRAALSAEVPYVALVASPKRGAAVLAELGLAPGEQERVSTPAGLDIAARTAGQVAVSILAELISRQGAAPAVEPAPESATDPVCGMTVPAAPTSVQVERNGQHWFFCSPGCREAFLQDPSRYDPNQYGA